MRKIMVSALLVGLAVPVVAGALSVREQAQELHADAQVERFRLEGLTGQDARSALRFMKKGEKALGKLVQRYAGDEAVDHKKLKLFAKAGLWIRRAQDTGAVPPNADPVTGWEDLRVALVDEVDALIENAESACDRLVNERFHANVTRRLDQGLQLYGDAAGEADPVQQAKRMARAVQRLRSAYQKAQRLCTKETRPNLRGAVTADGNRLTYRGRGTLTIFDLSWELTLQTREGVFVATRRGSLSDPGRMLPAPLPWTLARGETADALPAAGVALGFGHRIDGVVVWRTSAGEFEVPVHIDQ